jgi:hypothetical protein
MPSTSIPRAAMSVATSTRTTPDLKSFNARNRWLCERLECSVAVRTPFCSSCRASRSAACFMREKISTMSMPGSRSKMQQQRRLQMFRHFIDELRDRLGGIRAAADLHNFRRALKFVREQFDLLRERRGKHQRLPLLGQLLHDAPDVRQKSHVQHPVGLIQHEKF